MKPLLYLVLTIFLMAPLQVEAQLTERRVERLETRVEKLEHAGKSYAGAAFACAVVAALWAQNTRRNAWLWFFAALLFAPIAMLVLLYKNSNDVRRQVRP